MQTLIMIAASGAGAFAGLVLVQACRDALETRIRIERRLDEIRNRKYDFRIYERNWK